MFAITSEKLEGLDCIYCGDRATCRDHVVPFCYDNFTKVRGDWDYNSENVVPCCQSCNGHLGSMYLPSIAERAQHLANELSRQSKKILKSPDWTSAELKELSGSLRKTVQAMQIKKNLIRERLSHMQSMADNTGLSAKDYWDIMIDEKGLVLIELQSLDGVVVEPQV